MAVFQKILHARNEKKHLLAMLLDPDKISLSGPAFSAMLFQISKFHPDFLFVGGSTMTASVDCFVTALRKEHISQPIVLFPGSAEQFTPQADALLFLSLISGTNPDYLIGQQKQRALQIKKSGIEVIPTGYILLDGGTNYSTLRVTHTTPIAQDNISEIIQTAVAGELLGLKIIYLEAGSGAKNPVSQEVIAAIRQNISLPIIVGGGLRTPQAIQDAFNAGADLVVVGNALESAYLPCTNHTV